MLKLGPRISLRLVRATGSNLAASGLLTAGVLLTGAPALSCNPPLQPMQRIELIFGRDVRSHHEVGDATWTQFLAREITPRFPDGLTVLDATGQWRDPAKAVVTRERSRLVIIVTAAPSTDGRISAIVAAYKRRFHQKSVGVVTSDVCAGF